MSLALHYWMSDAHHCSGPPPVSEMTYTVSSGTLYSTISYHWQWCTVVRFVTSHFQLYRNRKLCLNLGVRSTFILSNWPIFHVRSGSTKVSQRRTSGDVWCETFTDLMPCESTEGISMESTLMWLLYRQKILSMLWCLFPRQCFWFFSPLYFESFIHLVLLHCMPEVFLYPCSHILANTCCQHGKYRYTQLWISLSLPPF